VFVLVALVGFLKEDTFSAWILCKTTVLFVSMVISYVLARGMPEA